MTAHIVVPSLDDAPATLSAHVLAGLLRDELGFDGLVVTDALEMRAVGGHRRRRGGRRPGARRPAPTRSASATTSPTRPSRASVVP